METNQVERLGVEEISPRPKLVHQIHSVPESKKPDYDNLISVLQAISSVLAVRSFLLLSVIGSFVLAFLAMGQESNHGIYVLVSYCLLTVLPLVWMSSKGK